MVTNFTDKEIQEIAGWKAWKGGRSFSRVFENLTIKDHVVSGVLKEGRKKIRTTVKQSDLLDYTPTCSCAHFYATNAFCEHAVALLLQAREVKNTRAVSRPNAGVRQQQHSESFLIEAHLQTSLSGSFSKSNVSLTFEISEGVGGNPLLIQCLEVLGIPLKVGKYPASVNLDQWDQLLKLNTSSPFLKKAGKAVYGSNTNTRFPLELLKRRETRLSITANIGSEWELMQHEGSIIFVNSEANAYNIQAKPSVELYGELIVQLLKREECIIDFSHYFDLEEDLGRWFNLHELSSHIQPRLEAVSPQVSLSISGTVRKIDISLRYQYLDNKHNKECSFLGYHSKTDTFQVKDSQAETSAALKILQCGAVKTSEEQFKLEGEAEIKEFIAYYIPQYKELGWNVEFLGSIRPLYHNSIVLKLTIKADEIHASDDWVSFQYSFQTPEGKGMKSGDVQRLIQAGKQSFSLKNGKQALISKNEYTLISESIKDYEVKQVSGKYSASKDDFDCLIKMSKNSHNKLKENVLDFSISGIFAKLRPYQKVGVGWLIQTLKNRGGGLLADDMGLGKTVQTLCLIDYFITQPVYANEPILIVCPASLISNWSDEINTWLPKFKVKVISGKEKPTPIQQEPEIYLTSYQKYLSDCKSHHEITYQICVLDEASVIRNSETKLARAISSQVATYKLALTGTPLENSSKDLWSIFNFVKPRYLGNLKEYNERFVKPLNAPGYTASLVSKRLRAKLSPFIIRRTKSEVLRELPPKTHRIEYCSPSQEQIKATETILLDYQTLKEEQETSHIQILSTILRLRQISNDPKLVNKEAGEISPKTKRLLDIMHQAKQLGKKVLIFSQFASMLDILESELEQSNMKVCKLTGSTNNRERVINEFKNDPEVNAFLISLKAGGYGLNLTEASIVVHYDPWWNPAVEAQATDRAYRIGQSEPVSVIKLITKNSVDEKILLMQKSKENLYQLAINDSELNLQGLTTTELESLI